MSDVNIANAKTKRKMPELTDGKIMIMLYLLSLIMMVAMACQTCMAYVLDETGTLANAAWLAGYDWSDFIADTGGFYYKYGTAFLYFLPMKFIKDSYWMYRGCAIAGGILYSTVAPIAYYVMNNYLKLENKFVAAVTAFAVAVIPSCAIYTTFARTEGALVAMMWISLLCMIKAAEADTYLKKSIYTVLLALAVTYAHMCHTRGLVWLIAATMTVVFVHIFRKKKVIAYIPFVIAVAAGWYVDKILTKIFKHAIWGSSGALHNTTSTFKFAKWLRMFSWTGIKALLRLGFSWLNSLIIGTNGIGFIGLIVSIIVIFMVMKKKYKASITDAEALVVVYGFLAYLGCFLMGILFFFNSIFKFVAGWTSKRADKFLYDRYTSVGYGIIVLIAVYFLVRNIKIIGPKIKIAITVLALGCFGYFHLFVVHALNNRGFSVRNCMGCGMFLDLMKYGNDSDAYPNISTGLQVGVVYGIGIMVLIFLFTELGAKKLKNWTRITATFMCLVLVVTLGVNFFKLRVATTNNRYDDAHNVIDQLEELPEEFTQYPVCVAKNVGVNKCMQVGLYNYRIISRGTYIDEGITDMFMFGKWGGDDSKVDITQSYVFADYEEAHYQVYVFGEKLRSELEEAGYELIPYTESIAQ